MRLDKALEVRKRLPGFSGIDGGRLPEIGAFTKFKERQIRARTKIGNHSPSNRSSKIVHGYQTLHTPQNSRTIVQASDSERIVFICSIMRKVRCLFELIFAIG